MILKADLHTHSYYSNLSQQERWPKLLANFIVDSKHTIEAVFEKAIKEKIDVISITDHDEITGTLEAINLTKKYDILAIPGIEITTGEGDLLA